MADLKSDSTAAQPAAMSAVPSSAGLGPTREQVTKLREANNKYKSLLKMAKERIQKQEDELEKYQAENRTLKGQIEAERLRSGVGSSSKDGGSGGDNDSIDATGESMGESSAAIMRVCQRIRIEIDDHTDEQGAPGYGQKDESSPRRKNMPSDHAEAGDDDDGRFEIWALIEFETLPSDPDYVGPNIAPRKQWKSWKRFNSESALSDYVRRDTGEPIVLPPYSLSPDQSARIEMEARQAVSHVTEEFRRYRVRAEVLRKQSDATLRALHSSNVHSTQQKIEGEDLANTLQQAKSEHAQLVALRNELKEQDTQWREAYDILLAENNALKGSGAEALLASQWRHRYEAACKEKEDLEMKLETATRQLAEGTADSKYEKKYREMKESFRLYRKKAKEIFEAQQRGEMIGQNGAGANGASGGGVTFSNSINDRVGEDARLAYLRNLMVNFLTSDEAVREHMETAIGTVLRFTEEDLKKVEQAKKDQESWFHLS